MNLWINSDYFPNITDWLDSVVRTECVDTNKFQCCPLHIDVGNGYIVIK